MMRIAGIIAEYNPFHQGHQYQIEETRRRFSADAVVVLMSGDFVQRGEPAVYCREVRTAMALAGGADAVFAMPAVFSASAARDFASFGVCLADALGIDFLCFGSESGDLPALSRIADILAEEPEEYGALLRAGIRRGESFPRAREEALLGLFPDKDLRIRELIQNPNNLLGIEYLTAGKHFKTNLAFETIRREDGGYHGAFSAEAIRRDLSNGKSAGNRIPAESLKAAAKEPPLFADDFSSLLAYAIIRDPYLRESDGLEGDLGNRLLSLPADARTWTETAKALKNKSNTLTSVNRALTRLLLGIRKDEADLFRSSLNETPETEKSCLYAEILGFRRESSSVIHELNHRSRVPVITRRADAADKLSDTALRLFEKDAAANHIYQLIRAQKGAGFVNIYRQGPVIL